MADQEAAALEALQASVGTLQAAVAAGIAKIQEQAQVILDLLSQPGDEDTSPAIFAEVEKIQATAQAIQDAASPVVPPVE